jgi:uncharacterized protein (TIGR03067 family)
MKIKIAVPFAILSVAIAVGDGREDAIRREQARFQGNWKLVEVKNKLAPDQVGEKEGKERVVSPGLEAMKRHEVSGVVVTIKNGELIVKNSEKCPPPILFEPGKYSFRFDLTTTPKGLTFVPAAKDEAKGVRSFKVIYLLDDDELWLCSHGNLDPPRDFSMDVGIAYDKVIWVLRREQEEKIEKKRSRG